MGQTTFLVLLGTCTLVLQSGCSKPAQVSASASPAVTRVAVAEVRRVSLTTELAITAEFRADQEVDVMAKVSGYLKKIEVDVGDRVSAGQLLATLEIPEMEDDLTKNAVTITRSQADLERAIQELKRAETVREMTQLSYSRLNSVMEKRPGLVAQQEIDTIRNHDMVAQAQIAAAKAAMAAAEQSVRMNQADTARIKTLQNYTKITAPFGGVVTKRYVDTGAMIQAGTSSHTQAMPLVRIAQTHVLRLILPVPESVVPRLKIGGTVQVHVESLGKNLSGRIARFSGQIQTATRTMETEVDVPNPRGTLVPGMFAQALLRLDERLNALSVPVDAIDHDKGRTVVLAVTREGILEPRDIVTGLETAERVEVKSGLAEGDLVVLGNRSQYKRGQKVEPKLDGRG
jgi:RND family efflux transporter MFP subunit